MAQAEPVLNEVGVNPARTMCDRVWRASSDTHTHTHGHALTHTRHALTHARTQRPIKRFEGSLGREKRQRASSAVSALDCVVVPD